MKPPGRSTHHDIEKKYRKLDSFFNKYFSYYRSLNRNDKKLFIKRVLVFIRTTRIIGKQGFKVNYEVKLLIAASAIQLTFGLKRFIFPRFRTFIIYNDVYYNQLTGQYHKGEVNPKGVTVISWKHFIAGYANPTDKLNVGLHEMAHAFLLNTMYTDLHDPNLDEFLVKVIHLSKAEIKKIKASESHFFRSYAMENVHEFFAVAVEHFFEAPGQFKNELPQLYKYLARLLNQDPANNIYRGVKYEDYMDPGKENNVRLMNQRTEFIANPGLAILQSLPKLILVLMIVNGISYGVLLNITSVTAHVIVQVMVNMVTLYFFFMKHYSILILTSTHLAVKLPLKMNRNYKTIHYDNILFVDFLKNLRIAFIEGKKIYYLTSFFHIPKGRYQEMCSRLIDKNVIVKGIKESE
jgi:Mlc titration factor MtfA (ptsG expression regulator)